MPKSFKYVGVERIFTKLERDFGMTSFNEYDVIEQIGEALEAIGCVNQYEEALAFIEVKNHQCSLPKNWSTVIQIAKNSCCSIPQEGVCAETIATCANSPTPDGLSPVMVDSCNQPVQICNNNPVIIDCHGNPITDYKVTYYRPFFDLQANYFGWLDSSIYKSCFHPVRTSNHSFFNTIVCDDPTFKDLYKKQHVDEYTIVEGELLRFSFNTGQIALAYRRMKLDSETGYPMMPDLRSVTEALSYYIQWKNQSREFYRGREGSEKRMLHAEEQWIFYCKQAGNEMTQLYGIDDYEDMHAQWKYLVPQNDRYYGFFGKLNKPENTLQYDDPNMRSNRGFRLFRGTALT